MKKSGVNHGFRLLLILIVLLLLVCGGCGKKKPSADPPPGPPPKEPTVNTIQFVCPEFYVDGELSYLIPDRSQVQITV
jgi:hypothetical protein